MFALYIFGLFGLSCLISYAIVRGKSPRRLKDLLKLSTITLRGSGGVYRSRITTIGADTILIDAPLHQESYLPIRVGETMRIEAGFDDQVAIFRAEVIARYAETHSLEIKPITEISHVNRRIQPRNCPEQWLPCELDGHPAVLIDYSASGAKVLTRDKYSTGDLVRIETPLTKGETLACVLEVKIDSHEGQLASQLRLVYNI